MLPVILLSAFSLQPVLFQETGSREIPSSTSILSFRCKAGTVKLAYSVSSSGRLEIRSASWNGRLLPKSKISKFNISERMQGAPTLSVMYCMQKSLDGMDGVIGGINGYDKATGKSKIYSFKISNDAIAWQDLGY